MPGLGNRDHGHTPSGYEIGTPDNGWYFMPLPSLEWVGMLGHKYSWGNFMGDKKSWREIDRQREKGGSRDERRGGRTPRIESATASYKRQLDAFFDKGVVPEHLKDKLPESSAKGPSERQVLLREIRDSKGGKALEKSLDRFLDTYELPDDPTFWLSALEHSKDAVLSRVLVAISEYLDTGMPLPRKGRFIERLKGLEFTSFDPRVQAKSMALVNRLRGLPDA